MPSYASVNFGAITGHGAAARRRDVPHDGRVRAQMHGTRGDVILSKALHLLGV